MGPIELERSVDEVDAHATIAWYAFQKSGGLGLAEGTHPRTGTPHKRVGSVVRGKYRVEAFLATGTMANVYSATHRNGAKVALKILHKQLAEDASLAERFKREGYFANSIGHPGVVRAIDDDVTEDGCPFLVMELLEGETLDERRRRKGGKLSLSWLLPVADALLDVLAAAHEHDVVHRDLKPDNIFVTKAGEVKVLDFGVARWADGNDSSDMTAVGMVLGTPAYMPPEQALGRREEVDAQSDLWAVGATLFVVLSGESVHEGGDAKAKLIATARTAARPLSEAAPEVPRAVSAVIDRALAFHKQERWPDARAMREALRWARLAAEDRPSQSDVTATSQPAFRSVPAPAPTRRAVDDEPTLAGSFPRPTPTGGAPGDRPPPADVLTSAQPITLRDIPTSTNTMTGPAEPVFSLRRAREGDDAPPTRRVSATDADRDGRAPTETLPTSEANMHAFAMPTDDPTAAIGDDAGGPPTNGSIPRSMDVNLSFTRPMATVTLPDDAPPRPADGAPMFPPPAAFPAASPSSAPPPPRGLSSTPPPGFAQLPTAPSLRAQAHTTSRPPRANVAPGPLLSEVVVPTRGRTARIVLPLAVAVAAVVAVVLLVRARALDAEASAAPTGDPPAETAATTTMASVVPPAATTPPSERAQAASGATPAPEPPPARAEAAPATQVPAASHPKPRPRRRTSPKPAAEPAATAEPAAASTSAAPAEPAPAAPTPEPAEPAPLAPPAAPTPATTTPSDSLPRKEPEAAPFPAPVPAPVPESAEP
jgi:eukaryotic-like serine/threonine-protein kinase